MIPYFKHRNNHTLSPPVIREIIFRGVSTQCIHHFSAVPSASPSRAISRDTLPPHSLISSLRWVSPIAPPPRPADRCRFDESTSLAMESPNGRGTRRRPLAKLYCAARPGPAAPLTAPDRCSARRRHRCGLGAVVDLQRYIRYVPWLPACRPPGPRLVMAQWVLGDTGYTWAEKWESLERTNFIRDQTEILTHATHVNGWKPAVYINYMSQNFSLFHVSN